MEREAELARKLAAARAEVTAERERHALETQRLRDDHAKVVDASTRAAKEAGSEDASAEVAGEHSGVDAAELDRVNAERDAAEAAGDRGDFREVREEAAAISTRCEPCTRASASSGREPRHCRSTDRKVVQDLADSKTARTRWRARFEGSTKRQGGRGRFRWAL